MPCGLSNVQLAEKVLSVLREMHKDPTISEGTVFGRDLNVDGLFKETYCQPIRDRIVSAGCGLGDDFSPDVCRKAKTVGEIVTAVLKAVKT